MKKRYTEEQIAFALRQHESGTLVAKIVRKMGIAEQTCYEVSERRACETLAFPRSSHRIGLSSRGEDRRDGDGVRGSAQSHLKAEN